MARVEKRGKNSYRLIVEGGLDGNGKRIRHLKTVKARNKTEAKVELSKFVAEIESETYIKPEKMTLSNFIDNEWIPKYASKTENLSPLTFKTYMYHIKNYIRPAFGHMYLGNIKTMHIITFIDNLSKPGARKNGKDNEVLSSGTIEYIYKVLRNILTQANKWRLIKINPMSGVSKPKAEYKKAEVFESDEADKVLLALLEEPLVWQMYFLTNIIGGLRRGETTALQWPNYFFNENKILINKNIPLTEKGKAVVGKPKNKASEGFVSMPGWYMDMMKDWYEIWLREKERVGSEWLGGDDQYVFHAGYGKPFYHGYPTKRWNKFIKKYGFKNVTLHGLRHTMASLLLEKDVPLKKIQERLRHSRYQTTADIYAHLTQKATQDVVNIFENYNPKKIGTNLAPSEELTFLIQKKIHL